MCCHHCASSGHHTHTYTRTRVHVAMSAPARRLETFKNVGKTADNRRHQRHTDGVQLRKASRAQQVRPGGGVCFPQPQSQPPPSPAAAPFSLLLLPFPPRPPVTPPSTWWPLVVSSFHPAVPVGISPTALGLDALASPFSSALHHTDAVSKHMHTTYSHPFAPTQSSLHTVGEAKKPPRR